MYFEVHCPTFDQEGSHDLSSLFQEMITSANLLGSKIYKVQEVWAGWRELRFAHHVMRGLAKGLQFFCLVSPSESAKVMGLKEIHHPDALCCHAGLSFCPWCRKGGQNEGAVVNHLWTMHCRLGLVCSMCLHYSTTTSEAMWHDGQVCRQSDTKEEDGGPDDDDASPSDWFTPRCPLHLLWFLRSGQTLSTTFELSCPILMFTLGWAFPASPWWSIWSFHPSLLVFQLQWGTLPLRQLTIWYDTCFFHFLYLPLIVAMPTFVIK